MDHLKNPMDHLKSPMDHLKNPMEPDGPRKGFEWLAALANPL